MTNEELFINNYNKIFSIFEHSDYINNEDNEILTNSFVNILEMYACNVYNEFWSDTEDIISESSIISGLTNNVKKLIDKSKENIKKYKETSKESYNEFINKLKIVKDFINEILNKTFNSLKEAIYKFYEILANLKLSIKDFIEKIGIDTEEFFKELSEDLKVELKKYKNNTDISLNESEARRKRRQSQQKINNNESKKYSIKDVIKSVIKEFIIYTVVVWLVPAVVQLVGTSVTATTLLSILQISYGSYLFTKQLYELTKLLMDPNETKNKSSLYITLRIICWFISTCLALDCFSSGIITISKGIFNDSIINHYNINEEIASRIANLIDSAIKKTISLKTLWPSILKLIKHY